MSELFSFMGICETCIFAKIHNCCGNFCYCSEGHEEQVDFYEGECEFKEERKENDPS